MNLTDYFWLKRAGRFANPLNSNDRLPVVYGSVLEGQQGNWILPCIDTVNHVYCYCGHPATDVIWSPSQDYIFIDGVGAKTIPETYSVNYSNPSYENMATVTFTNDMGNAIISARGYGKADSTGLTWMANIVEIIEDFLTVENGWTAALFESTAKARARAVFESQGYVAGGVITEDAPVWDIIQQMMGSFYGSAFLDGNGRLVLEIDDGTIKETSKAGVVSKADLKLIGARQRMANLINKCPASYAYDYTKFYFRSHTDETAHHNLASQAIYGLQEPASPMRFYWSRDLATVQKIQDIIVGKYAYPTWEIDLEDISLKNVGMDTGDLFAASVESCFDQNGSAMINQLWRLVSIMPQFERKKIRMRALDTGSFLTAAELADGSILADGSSRAGGGRDLTVY